MKINNLLRKKTGAASKSGERDDTKKRILIENFFFNIADTAKRCCR